MLKKTIIATSMLLPIAVLASNPNSTCDIQFAQSIFNASQQFAPTTENYRSLKKLYQNRFCEADLPPGVTPHNRQLINTSAIERWHNEACHQNRDNNLNMVTLNQAIIALGDDFHTGFNNCLISTTKPRNRGLGAENELSVGLTKPDNSLLFTNAHPEMVSTQPDFECALEYDTSSKQANGQQPFIKATIHVNQHAEAIDFSDVTPKGMHFAPQKNGFTKERLQELGAGEHTIYYKVKRGFQGTASLSLEGYDANGDHQTSSCQVLHKPTDPTGLTPGQKRLCEEARQTSLRKGWVSPYDYSLNRRDNQVTIRDTKSGITFTMLCSDYAN
jgi:hypothetical protein